MPKGYSNGLPLKPPVSKKGKYQPLASLETRNKMSEVAKNNGYTFHFPKLEGALGDLVGKS